MTDERIYQIGLTMINGIGDILARHLLENTGSAESVFKEKSHQLEKIPGIGSKHINEIRKPDVLHNAEKELTFIEKNKITICFIGENTYPTRLRECPDAPIVFYYKGNSNLNTKRIISIVGTRRSTHYGKEQTENLIKDIADIYPDLLVVSGLAYGIDIQAHRASLKHKLPTVGVLAHGLDRIYPSAHRSTAVEMLASGGLLTDFPSGTNPDRPNFVRRNRIVAGLADATIVVESAEKGGSLITADIAFSYGRDVLAFPGRSNDLQSKGCNGLIRQNKAGLITSAEDLISALCWDNPKHTKKQPQETYLPFSDDRDYGKMIAIMKEHKEIHINQLALLTDMPVYKLSALLFDLELNDMIKTLPGSVYTLKNK